MCNHHWTITSADQPDQLGRRHVTFTCDACGEQLTKFTARTAKQIEAELAAQ